MSRPRPVQGQPPLAWHMQDLGMSLLSDSFVRCKVNQISPRFVQSILKAASGEKGIKEECYLYLPGIPGGDKIAKSLGVDYFAVPVEFGVSGAEKALSVSEISKHEETLLATAIAELKGNIQKGIAFCSS